MGRVALIGAAVVLVVAGCGGDSTSDEVRVVVEDFTADLGVNPERSCRHFPQDERRGCRLAMLIGGEELTHLFTADVDRIAVQGSSATAALTNDVVVRLRRSDDKWLLEEIDHPGSTAERDENELPTTSELTDCLSEGGSTGLRTEQVGEPPYPVPMTLGYGPSGAPVGVVLTNRPFVTREIAPELGQEWETKIVAGERAVTVVHRSSRAEDLELAEACLSADSGWDALSEVSSR